MLGRKLAIVVQQELSLACPKFFYTETNLTEHWNADARAGFYATLRSVLDGMTVRGTVPTTGDSMLFSCGVHCGVGALGLPSSYGEPFLTAARTVETAWCIVLACTVYRVCAKRRYRRSMFLSGYLLLQIPYGLSTVLKWTTNTAYFGLGKHKSWCFSDGTLFEGVAHTGQEVLCTIVGRMTHIESFLWIIGFMILNLCWYWSVKDIEHGGTSFRAPLFSFLTKLRQRARTDESYMVEFGVCVAAIILALANLGNILYGNAYVGHPIMQTCVRAYEVAAVPISSGPLFLVAPTLAFLVLSARKTLNILRTLNRMSVKGRAGAYQKCLSVIYRRQLILGVFLVLFLFFLVPLLIGTIVLRQRSAVLVQSNLQEYLRCHLLAGNASECDHTLLRDGFWFAMMLMWTTRQLNGFAMILLLSFALDEHCVSLGLNLSLLLLTICRSCVERQTHGMMTNL